MSPGHIEYGRPLIDAVLATAARLDSSWIFRFGPEIEIATEAVWRLTRDRRIVVTSEDHGHPFGRSEPVDAVKRLFSSLEGRVVTAAAIDTSTGDLSIDFGEQARLQFLQVSSGYESWRLTVRGTETICLGGGEVAHFGGCR